MTESSIHSRVETAIDRCSQAISTRHLLRDVVRIERLTGDASNRIYMRVHFGADRVAAPLTPSPSTLMAMVLPLEVKPSEEFGSPSEGSERLPFIEVAEWLHGRGVPVPELFFYDSDNRILLLEDLGDQTLERELDGGDAPDLYDRAVDLLVEFQRRTRDPEPELVATGRALDRAVLSWELQHYVEWRLEVDLALPAGSWKAALTRAFDDLLDDLCRLPVRLVHRDFQSRNLMCLEGGDLCLIDFQDALMGPFIYDAVALLRDSYVVLSDAEIERLLSRYYGSAREAGVFDLDETAVKRAFLLQTVQRKLKDTGRFVFIDRVKDNPTFLPYRAPSMAYVRSALAALEGHETLRNLIAELDPE